MAALCLAATACRASRPAPAPRAPAQGYPGVLRPPSEIRGDFLARQAIQGRYGEEEIRFETVLQKQGNVLTLIGLTPFGTRAFLLRQVGTEVTFEPYVKRELPFPPRYILIDVHRSLFIGISADPLSDGVHEAVQDDERITERWAGGLILERRFERRSGNPPGAITITCKEGMRFGVPPGELRFENGWFGYELLIRTTAFSSLPSTDGDRSNAPTRDE